MNGHHDVEPTGARELSPGSLIGPYQLLFKAAEGGMATVWAARRQGSRGFQQIVALKVLSDLLREDPDGRAMFLDEARTAACIIHPNVGQVLDYGEDGGRPYMAMEWIDGESLARLASAQRARGARLPLRWVLQVAIAACAGLHAAHEARDDDGEPMHLVHRDVSPQNIMVTFDGFTKVVDFGVAKSRRRAQVTRVGVIKGKTGYFSPEQVGARELDRRSDIFAFGVLLYVLLTDHHPFRGRSAVETVQNIAVREPFAPREIVPDLPRALDALILRALAKDPADRPATMAELGRELEQIAVSLGGPLPDRSVGAVVEGLMPGASGTRRNRLVRAAQLLDRARRERRAVEEPASAPGEADPVGQEITFSVRRPEVKIEELTRHEGPLSRTTRGTALSARAPSIRPARRTSLVLPALALLGASMLAARAGEHLALPAAASAAPPAALAGLQRAAAQVTAPLAAPEMVELAPEQVQPVVARAGEAPGAAAEPSVKAAARPAVAPPGTSKRAPQRPPATTTKATTRATATAKTAAKAPRSYDPQGL